MNNFEVNANLELFDYLLMVNEIALEFFNEDGVYQPHIGKINAMRLFYNKCVVKSKYDEKYGHDVVDAMDMVEIVSDAAFISEYNDAIAHGAYANLDFGNAYKDAMDIVNVRKSSLRSAVNIVGSMLNRLVENISGVLTDDNIAAISQIAKEISNGNISAEAVVNAYADRMEKASENKNNIIPLHPTNKE